MVAGIGLGPSRSWRLIFLGSAWLTATVFAVGTQNRAGYAMAAAMGLAACAPILVTSPRLVICVAAASTLIPQPSSPPFAISVGGGTLYLADLLTVAGAALCIKRCFRPSAVGAVLAGSGFLAVGLIGAAIHHPQIGLLGRDTRGPLQLVLGTFIGVAAMRDARLGQLLLRTLSVVLWWAAAAVGLSIVSGTDLTFGRDLVTSTLIGNVLTTYSSNRFQLDVSNVAALVLATVVSLLLLGHVTLRAVAVPFLLPSFFLAFESFARNNLIMLAVGVLLAFILAVRRGAVFPTVWRMLGGGVLSALVLACAYEVFGAAGSLFGGSNPLAAQLTAYKGRVLDTLTGKVLQADSSTQFRVFEWHNAWLSFRRSPIIGHGFGAPYRALLVNDPFPGLGGTIYVHNWYGWILAKTGVAGCVFLAVLLLAPVPAMFTIARQRARYSVVASAVLVSTFSALAATVVAPFAEASGSSLYLGCVAGVGWGLLTEVRRSDQAAALRFVNRPKVLTPVLRTSV